MAEKITPELLKKFKDGSLQKEGKKIVYDPKVRQMLAVRNYESMSRKELIPINSTDRDLFGLIDYKDNENNDLILVISEQHLIDYLEKENNCLYNQLYLSVIDKDVIRVSTDITSMIGKISTHKDINLEEGDYFLYLNPIPQNLDSPYFTFKDQNYYVECYLSSNKTLVPIALQILPIRSSLFSRTDGLYETGKLSNAKVLIIGLGSGGSTVALELAKAGIMNFTLIDPDRLEVGNVVRHICGISDVGRYKTKAVSDQIKDKNPYVNIKTYQTGIDWDNYNDYLEDFKNTDLVICATDNPQSKQLINKICIDNSKTCIYGGAFRRAYGGEVLRVIPHETLCYECFLEQLPKEAFETQVFSSNRIQYSNAEVEVEPGLSTDILPISIFMTKLAILELLKNVDHSMQSLYEDFKYPYYFWINRREYDYSNLTPLWSGVGEITILGWYAVDFPKLENCPTCGNSLKLEYDGKPIDITEKDLSIFG